MRNGKDNNSCLFGEQLVSYIYDELPASGREMFENHLLNCSGCTDEFAAISMSRLGVYEWHRDDFLPLETPVFTIPYERPVVATETQISWLDALRGLFSPARLAAAGTAFALIAVAFASVYISTRESVTMIANTNAEPSIETIKSETVPPRSDESVAESNGSNAATSGAVQIIDRPNTKPAIPVQTKVKKRGATRQAVIQASNPQKAPRLGTFDDVEDKSLRLSDLVASIDSYDF